MAGRGGTRATPYHRLVSRRDDRLCGTLPEEVHNPLDWCEAFRLDGDGTRDRPGSWLRLNMLCEGQCHIEWNNEADEVLRR